MFRANFAGLLPRALAFLAGIPAALKAKLCIIWSQSGRAVALPAACTADTAHGVRAILNLEDTKAGTGKSLCECQIVEDHASLSDLALIMYTR